ncbi:SDR family NAD(P)-dependent oxidoreductase [Amorphus orientalis]|uniref:NAD(P)-dependent dehydrogenase (Short-subunit alcohol dehydrogenase family) n=1 Tax=Amorphus orientalis TaxID=649198 RepID=A0AAE3VL60_9HYPH|nr:SDR family oxidoreductase [Amorphus orientalis]MDQ0314529.1 NAD(P)-dependent dehydrogenase (short-subunit alcohol dehydrogenase family) [Amorphus orientalis]
MTGSDAPIAFVTGGTGAIGLAVAVALRDAGYRTIAAALSGGTAALPEGIEGRDLDVSDPASIAASLADLSSVSVLVNAAGITAREGREFDPDVFCRIVDINLNGAMRMSMAAHPLLRKAKTAAVVNICSMLSFFGSPTVPAYSASKGGLLLLTKSLAAAWAEEGIRVNAVAPGYIETDLTQALHTHDAHRTRIEARTPMGRWGKPEDVTGAVLFLCSPGAGFVTGAVIAADGGYSAI